ncbi:fucolectin-like, partial [Myxocyprinus asiaticus]|uniref:fucolectin-like n=1 Tax=Myxocyprinus asiaticus TaxID=70543 RepID=UPI002222F2AC
FGDASNATHDPNYDHGSCTATRQWYNTWWRVDLLDKYVVTSITITNRKDCCPERLDRAEICIGNSLENNGNQGSCTDNVLNPWWRVDLLKTHNVFRAVITNRADHFPEKEIRIGNSLDNNGNDNPRCAVVSSVALGFSTSFECNGMDRRSVNIVIPGQQEYLTLCEVELYG